MKLQSMNIINGVLLWLVGGVGAVLVLGYMELFFIFYCFIQTTGYFKCYT